LTVPSFLCHHDPLPNLTPAGGGEVHASTGWFFLTRLKSDRLVDPDGQGNRPIREVEIPPTRG